MVNTFMATAIDLGDPASPYGDIHPRYKQQVAARLSQAAINVIYGESELYWLGPVAYEAVAATNISAVVISFRNIGNLGLQIKNSVGFELLVGNSWQYNTNEIDFHLKLDLLIKCSVKMVRYNWYTAPCMPLEGIYQCAIYDQMSQLPATPFILSVQ
ncbi:hypothetical protein RFI_23489 [Reticulomyxa filosa]|uniref:Uncharacterized protein n=1 Tax=Reticulomyxa filosa TaxID=46433 RepID=X6MKC8_RETFI|nr:hypothetical protein RFI_23489 [Reticulomyxa filosa]|eukprot:ETO13877.1 hypothetical protein RFI_23489 [Reticulomyxa filosa]